MILYCNLLYFVILISFVYLKLLKYSFYQIILSLKSFNSRIQIIEMETESTNKLIRIETNVYDSDSPISPQQIASFSNSELDGAFQQNQNQSVDQNKEQSLVYDPLKHCTEKQLKSIKEFQETIKKYDQLKAYHEDLNLIYKYLVARDWKQSKSLELWLNREKDAIKFNLYNLVYNDNIRYHATHGKAFVYGLDNEKHPVIIIKSDALFRSANEYKNLNISYDEYIERSFEYALYLCEIAMEQKGVNPDCKITVVYDRLLHSVSLFGVVSHLKMLKRIASLNDLYPELLHRMFIIRPNSLFQAGWKIFSAFLAPSTSEKVILLNHVKDLQKYIPKDQLIRTLGGPGNLPTIPIGAKFDYEDVPKDDDIYEDWKFYTEELSKSNVEPSVQS